MKIREPVAITLALLASSLACSTLFGASSTSTSEPSLAPSAVPAASPTQPQESGPVGFLDFLPSMTLTTPTSGGGIRPVLAWDPVDGAAWYGVYLYAPNQELYWSWQGRETSVPVGGRPKLNDDSLGPSVVEGMTWNVIAYDANNLPVASGGPRPIAP
ncbi:MAG: hypothetical protein WBZ24_09550 [Anaerolineales bacterium]|jgi:hypothetical protein